MESQEIQGILNLAQQAVYEEHKSTWGQIKIKIHYTGRKTIRNLPATAAKNLGSLIPKPLSPIGTLVDAGVEAGLTKLRNKRIEQKSTKYVITSEASVEQLRKRAKFDAKKLVDIIDQLERNQVKLKDARNNCNAQLQVFNTTPKKNGVVQKGEVPFETATKIYELKYYEDKIIMLIEIISVYLKHIETYVLSSETETIDLIENFAKALEGIDIEGYSV